MVGGNVRDLQSMRQNHRVSERLLNQSDPPLRCHSAAGNELRASRRVLSFSYFTAQELTETTGTVKPTAVSSAVDTVLFL